MSVAVPQVKPTTQKEFKLFSGHLFMLVKTNLENSYKAWDEKHENTDTSIRPGGSVPDFSEELTEGEIQHVHQGLENLIKALFQIPTRTKAGKFTKEYLSYMEVILHLYNSTKNYYRSRGGVYGYTPAFCTTYYKNMSSAKRAIVLKVKNCDKITMRATLAYEDKNEPRKCQAERVKMVSAMVTKISKLIYSYRRNQNKCSAEKVNPEFQAILDRFEASNANANLLKSRRILTVNEEYFTSLVLTRQADLIRETYGQIYSSSDCFPTLNRRDSYFWRTGRYNSSNFHAGLPKEIKAYAYKGYYNYDMSDAHVQVLRNILAYIKNNVPVEKFNKDATEAIKLIDIDLEKGKEAISAKLGVEVGDYKKMKYTLLNGGDLSKSLCPTRQELVIKYGRKRTKKIVRKFNKLEIAKAFKLVPDLLIAYHFVMEDKEFRNNITSHEVYEKVEGGFTIKRLTAYYLQGGESEFIYRLMRECMDSGIQVVAYEYDGIVTDKPIPDSIVAKVNQDMGVTYPYSIKNKPFI